MTDVASRPDVPRPAGPGRPAPAGEPPSAPSTTPTPDLGDPALYLNRELTWLEFNRRVLSEAEDDRNPLLERVKFLAITGSNLDEFFMKRIGGLKQQVAAGMHELTVDGRTPQQQIAECLGWVRDFERVPARRRAALLDLLAERDIRLLDWAELTSAEQRARVREQYLRNIFPLVTPLAIDPAHPFPLSRTCR